MPNTKTRRKRSKPRILTYRTQPESERYFHDHAERLIGGMVVIYDPREDRFERAVLQSVGKPGTDSFRISWEGRHRKLKGLWRVHQPGLFGSGHYPRKRKPAARSAQVNGVDSIPENNDGPQRRTKSMATKAKGGAAAKKESKGRGRPSALDGLTDAKRTALAKRVLKLREQGVPWDGDEGICAQVDGVTSAVIGRKLLREAGGDDMIRDRAVTNGGARAKGKAAPKSKAKPAKKTAAAKKGKKVVVRRGQGRSSNPS